MGYEFLRIETPMTKLSMNRANQRRTDIFIARAGRITPGFPFHISEWALALRAGAIFVWSLAPVLAAPWSWPPSPAVWVPEEATTGVSLVLGEEHMQRWADTSWWGLFSNPEVETGAQVVVKVGLDPSIWLLIIALNQGLAKHGPWPDLSGCMFLNSFTGTSPCLLVYRWSLGPFVLHQRSGVVVKKTIWPIEPKMFTTRSFGEKVC